MRTRHVYCALIGLHPFRFRSRFGAEMVWIFEQPGSNHLDLMLDAVLSLIRQWLLRSGLWKFAVGLVLNAVVVASCVIGPEIFGPKAHPSSGAIGILDAARVAATAGGSEQK